MKRYSFLFAVCALSACGRGGNDCVDGIIVFDNSKDYPELDLKLSDVADVTYIALKGVNEGYPVDAQFKFEGKNAYIHEDEIYFISNAREIYVFDIFGTPLRQLNRIGRGPEEYGDGILNFWSEPDNNSVCVIGTNNLIKEYDAESFKFKSSFPYEFSSRPTDVISLNRDYLILHGKRPLSREISPVTYHLFLKSNRMAQPLPPKMERPYDFDDSFLLTYPGLTYGRDGVFMNNTRCDTIWRIDRQTLEVFPRMVDKSKYFGKNMKVLPSFETDRYIFFSPIYQKFDWVDNQTVPINTPWPEDRMFAFDKEKEKIFRISMDRSDPFPDGDSPIVDRKFAWAFDECWLTCWHTTLNDNYGAAMYQAYELLDNMDKLPPELKKIAETLNENDNPVLALIKFKENE